MVPVVARVDDPARGALRPGTFAEVTIPIGSRAHAPSVPQTALRASERGTLAYVVENGVARERVVEPGLRTESGLVEVRRGLEAGETLVVRGAEALSDGARVRVIGAERSASPTRGREP
jgi:multidrug efflux system membrane fusion protein